MEIQAAIYHSGFDSAILLSEADYNTQGMEAKQSEWRVKKAKAH